jgi:hypothetical protein
MLTKETPDHHDAELVLRLYELRRDPMMREARETIATKFAPKSAEDVLAVTARSHPLNAAFRQVSSYWEMVYGMARYGIIHPDFLMENCGEGLLLYAKVHPYLEEFRSHGYPRGFRNAEWVAENSQVGREVFARFQQRLNQAT